MDCLPAHIFWSMSNKSKAKAKTSIRSIFCVNAKSHSGFGQIFNLPLSLSLSPSLCINLSLLLSFFLNNMPLGCEKKKLRARIPTPPLFSAARL